MFTLRGTAAAVTIVTTFVRDLEELSFDKKWPRLSVAGEQGLGHTRMALSEQRSTSVKKS